MECTHESALTRYSIVQRADILLDEEPVSGFRRGISRTVADLREEASLAWLVGVEEWKSGEVVVLRHSSSETLPG